MYFLLLSMRKSEIKAIRCGIFLRRFKIVTKKIIGFHFTTSKYAISLFFGEREHTFLIWHKNKWKTVFKNGANFVADLI